MSKRTYGHVLVLSSQRLVRTAAEDDFVICRNARMDMCLCYQVDVSCVLQLKMTLLKTRHVFKRFKIYLKPERFRKSRFALSKVKLE